MAIRASSAKEIDNLLTELGGGDAVAREAAIARLTVIGSRAVDRLATLALSTASAGARAGALRALERIGDRRALDVSLRAIDDADADVAAAAIDVARTFLRGADGAVALDRLTAAALDSRRPQAIRVAAVHALRDLDAATIGPLMASLATDADAAIRAEAQGKRAAKRGGPAPDPAADLARAAEGHLPDNPEALRHLLAAAGDRTPLPTLSRIVERVRDREASETSLRRAQWAATRAAAHLALARRGSRVALYDLRESLERAAEPLPVDALAALALIGDASCLEPIASAHARADAGWWKDRLADTFRTIVKRERLTRRHAAIKKIEARWKSHLNALWGEPRRSSKPGKSGR